MPKYKRKLTENHRLKISEGLKRAWATVPKIEEVEETIPTKNKTENESENGN